MADGDAMAAFCREHHARLIGLIALQVGDRAVAEELAQEVLVRVCERWPTIEQPRAWASRVAMNLSASWWRRRYAEWRANARHTATAGAGDRPPDGADVLAVRRAVAQLPRRQREAVAYRFYAGLSVAETAAAMDCARGTVRALTHQAVTALREDAGLLVTGDDEEETADVS